MNYRYTSAPERRERLMQFIAAEGYCTILELSREFDVSEMTIRRDIQKLADQGKVRSFRGAVGSLSRTDARGIDYQSREVAMHEQKFAIAQRAAAMIAPESVIAIDAGTTAKELAMILPHDHSLQVVTHSLPVVETLISNPGTEVLCLGGTLHPESLSFDGPTTLASVESVRANMMFLAASAISERGVYNGNGHDAIIKRALIDVSEKVVLLADSSKLALASMVKICDWHLIDTLITDDGISDDDRRNIEQQGVEMIVVAPATVPAGADR